MSHHFNFTIRPLGDSALTVQLEPTISLEINNHVQQIARDLTKTPLIGMVELIPAYCTLTIIYNMLEVPKNGESICPYETIKFKLMDRI
jgi:inhibitor of KinA